MKKRRLSPILLICKHCGRKFHPSVYHVHDQCYCTRESCHMASRCAASKLYRETKKAEDAQWREKEAARVQESRARNRGRRRPPTVEERLRVLLTLLVGLLSQMTGEECDADMVESLFGRLQVRGAALAENSEVFETILGCS